MIRILFLGYTKRCRTQMAAALAKSRNMPDVEVCEACTIPAEPSPDALQVLEEIGITGTVPPPLLSDITDLNFDVVISLDHNTGETPIQLPGHPECIHWAIDNPETAPNSEALSTYRAYRDRLRTLVNDLFDQGYLEALVAAHRHEQLILNNVSDGILAHDLERRIIHFNRAAEIITGFSREEVIYRNCHDALPGGFCGGRCRFTEDGFANDGPDTLELEICRKDGERRRIRQKVTPLKDQNGSLTGALFTFTDITREQRLARRIGEVQQFSGIIGSDERMLEVFDLIRDLADTSMPVLIQGESGTGKELVAAAIHNEGPRANRQFVPVNCGALPESLLESELFGHVKGSFTGAFRDKKGRFELADGGTIFLDEIGDISPAMQVRLLRVLQEGTFERVGGEETHSVDVRVISATNKNLEEEIEECRFREDLFYRLSVVPLWIPALRDRRNDIPILVEHILHDIQKSSDKPAVKISPRALDAMLEHDWPGNVRELQNWIQFALVRSRGKTIEPENLPPHFSHKANGTRSRRGKLNATSVSSALRETDGNKLEAAKRLGVSRATLYRFLDSVKL
jgi:PAS domain S-box-containing protein